MHTKSAPTPALDGATFDSARYSALLPDAPVTGISLGARHSSGAHAVLQRPKTRHWSAALPAMKDAALTAVEDVVAEILHLEDGSVGTAGRRLVEMRLDHLADHDVMVALLDDVGDAAFHGARRVDQQRRAR